MPIIPGPGGLNPESQQKLDYAYGESVDNARFASCTEQFAWFPWITNYIDSDFHNSTLVSGRVLVVPMVVDTGAEVSRLFNGGISSRGEGFEVHIQYWDYSFVHNGFEDGYGESVATWQTELGGTPALTSWSIDNPIKPKHRYCWFGMGMVSPNDDDDMTVDYFGLSYNANLFLMSGLRRPMLWNCSSRWTSGPMPSSYDSSQDTLVDVDAMYQIFPSQERT